MFLFYHASKAFPPGSFILAGVGVAEVGLITFFDVFGKVENGDAALAVALDGHFWILELNEDFEGFGVSDFDNSLDFVLQVESLHMRA